MTFPGRLVGSGLLLAAGLFLVQAARSKAGSWPTREISQTTEDRMEASGWWPTKNVPSESALAGTAECAKCHADKAETQASTPMANAAAAANKADILRGHELLTRELNPYHYEIQRKDAGSEYSVRNGNDSLSAALNWALGVGHKGQTYVYQRGNVFYESRLSYYKSLQGLDLTTGHSAANPTTLEAALGRRLDGSEARHCFGCHTSGSMIAGRFDPAHAMPGVSCEQCHGPGVKHVAAMKAGKIEEGRRAILNPRRLHPVASIDFCGGACHRSWADVVQAGTTGVANVRFQPYRLENSRCWGNGDARLACLACHDPHQQLVKDAGAYDQKCLSCHVTTRGEKVADHPGAACPVSKVNCVTCHMPQVEMPSMHATFTDHLIPDHARRRCLSELMILISLKGWHTAPRQAGW